MLSITNNCPAQTPSKLNYQKKESRQATYAATLKANQHPLFGPWSQVGPFDPVLRRPQPPEETPHATEYSLSGGGQTGWRREPDYLDGYANTIRIDRIERKTLVRKPTICLKRTITTTQARKIRVYLGCDAGFILWLNNRPLLYAGNLSKLEPGQESVMLPLLKGANTLVLKISLTRTPCRFFFQPEFGKEMTGRLLSRLDRDFPHARKPLTGYRERASRKSSEA
ncbi:MAG: hypothetical protein IH899_04975, partial [Planctomycetes bacterium]|nr:hypothetical protein [Planctomycetota bacterium]